jgi:glyoxylase-like metal-dependent hydrolase (beta-lactamase superfamily II)
MAQGVAQDESKAAAKPDERARQLLDAGIAALGGLERLRAASSVMINYRSVQHPPGQTPVFNSAPIDTPVTNYRTMIDYAGQRYVSEATLNFPTAYSLANRTVITPQRGFIIDPSGTRLGNLVTSLLAPAQGPIKFNLLLEVPHLLLLNMLQPADTLRFLGEQNFGGHTYEAISFDAGNNAPIKLFFDPQTKLLAGYQLNNVNPVLGDTQITGIYSDYQGVGGVRVPKKRRIYWNDYLFADVDYERVTLDFSAAESLLDIPAGYAPAPVSGAAANPVRKLGDGVYLLDKLPGGYRVMFVEFNDHVMVLETPLNQAVSQAAIALIKKTVPDKPVRYVSFSHFHFDHSGGLRQYIAEGATVITTPGNRAFVEQMAQAKFEQRPDALAQKPRQPVIETLDKKRVFTDGTRTVELYQVGPIPHAREMIIFYFPKEKILFQADMNSVSETGEMRAIIENNRILLRKVKELKLDVDMLVGVHGPETTWQAFTAAVNKQPAGSKQSAKR